MTVCLYECLRAVGLHGHYARFISAGVCRAAHLSVLTMEDYPFLGIRSMEDRTRLFHLIQMVKTLDLESLEYEDCDDYFVAEGVNEGYPGENRSIPFGNWTDPDEDAHDEEEKGPSESELRENSFSQSSCVRRQLDFSCESINHHEELFPHPVAIDHASHARNYEQCTESDIPVHLEHTTGSAVVCSCKGSSNHRTDAQSFGFTHRTGANSRHDILGGISMNISHTRLSPKCVSSHKTKPRLATALSKKDRRGNSRKEKLSNNTVSGHKTEPTPVYELKRTAGYNYGLPLSAPPTPSKKKSAGQRISVCVRKRPLTRAECRRGEADVVTTLSGECVIVHESKEAVDLAQYILQHRFYFDHVFGEESSNEEVYGKTAYPLVQHMLRGGKATCFAYGQTGAGKTHTMLGSSPGKPGLYALAVRDIFAHLANTHMHSPLLVYVSFFEIYCGQLYDLLDHRKRLFAREDGQKVVHIAGLHHVRVDSVNSLLEVISQGTEERTQGTSGVNPFSSRSHALLQIQLRDPNHQISGRMWFVDLAGSERASDTKEPDRQSRMEGAEINQSLLALKECIRSLDQEQSHTPFRQSKLTQVLKDSFVGDSMTCMIANISPGHFTTEHTLNTLRYADRVKELKGTKGERRKAAPKCNLSSSNSSSSGGSNVSSPGKRSPKKTKLGRQREAFGQTSVSRMTTGGTVLCSTPKNGRWEKESSARARHGLEQITPIRCLPQKVEKRERTSRREGTRKESCRENKRAVQPICDQKLMEQLDHGQQREQLHLWEVQRKSGLHRIEKENQQQSLKSGEESNRTWVELRRHVESSRAPSSEMERLRVRDKQTLDEKDKERERHLRWYHQQLQQFLPSPASSTDHFLSSNTTLSTSSPYQASLSSSVSPSSGSAVQHSSSIPISPLKYNGLEKVYRGQTEVKTERGQLSSSSNREISLQSETSPTSHNNTGNIAFGESGGISGDWQGPSGAIETGFRQNKCERAMRVLKATGEGEGRARMEGPAGLEGAGERRWAWVATAPTDKEKDRMTDAWPADAETQVSHNCDSEVGEVGLDASAVPAIEGQEGAGGCNLMFTHSTNDNNSLFNCSPVELSHQRAPAERPLSPAGEHADTLLTSNKVSDLSLQPKHVRCTSNILPIPNDQHGELSGSCRDKEPGLDANRRDFSNPQLAKLPLTSSVAQNGYKIPAESTYTVSGNPSHCQVLNHSEVKAKMSVLTQGETSADSLSYTMDPLSISLLQVDQQVATGSFLQGEQIKATCCLMQSQEDKKREEENGCLTSVEMTGNIAEDQDEEFRLSLLELPGSLTHRSSTSTSMVATPSSRVTLVSLQDHDSSSKPQTMQAPEVLGDKTSASVLKPPVCASLEASVMTSISPCVQNSGKTGSADLRNQATNGATQTPLENAHRGHNRHAFSISTPQSESTLCQGSTLPKLPHPGNLNQSNNSNISQQPNGSTETCVEKSTNQQVRPIIHLSMLEDIYHSQWRVVQAHWEQLEEMQTLSRKEGALLYQQPDMAFGEYVHRLGEILERKAQCVHSMITQLQPYLKTSHPSQPHNQGEDKKDQIT